MDSRLYRRAVADTGYRLHTAERSPGRGSDAKEPPDKVLEKPDHDVIKREHEQKFQAIRQAGSQAGTLRIFKEKDPANAIGQASGSRNGDCCPRGLRMPQDGKHPEPAETLAKCLPPEIARQPLHSPEKAPRTD